MYPHLNNSHAAPVETPTPNPEGDKAEQKTSISIQVSDPTSLFEGWARYTAYKIKGVDAKGEFQVNRRYNDFFKLREVLKIQFPGCHIPSLPPKEIQELSFDFMVVNNRVKHLNIFCQKIAEMPYIHYHEIYQTFLSGLDGGARMTKHLEHYTKPNYAEIVARYENIFPNFQGAEPHQEMIQRIVNFKKFLKMFESSVETCEIDINHCYRRPFMAGTINNPWVQKESKFEKEASFASSYENSSSNKVYGEDGQPVLEASKKASLNKVAELRQAIASEMDSFLEAIELLEVYEGLQTKVESRLVEKVSKLNDVKAGKLSLRGMLTTKTKEERLKEREEKVAKAQADIEAVRKLNKVIPLIFHSEMEEFLNEKVYNYLNIARNENRFEVNKLQDVQNCWNELFGNANC